MMRFFRICFILLVCFLMTATVYADSGLEITGPDTVYPRETFEIIVLIDRADITKITFELDSDWENLQLQAMWVDDESAWRSSTDMVGHVMQRLSPGTDGQQIVFRARVRIISPQEGIRVWLAMRNIVLWTEETSWQIEDILWEQTVARIVSDDNYLSSLQLADAVLSPEFSAYQQNYIATVPHFVAQASVTAIPRDDSAFVQVDSPVLEYGKTTNVTVTVTAEDQSVRVYTIAVTREDAPNRIPSSNCTLGNLEVTDYKLSPQFSPGITEYVLWLPYETTKVEITATPADKNATVSVEGNKGFKAGQDNPISVTCTAEDGTQKTYTIIAKRAEPYVPQPSETVTVTAPTMGSTMAPGTAPTMVTITASTTNGTVSVATPNIPVWVYVVVAVAAVTGFAAVGILITDRKK